MSDERARDGVEHLQNAARELIAAARAFLDVAEEVVDDPAALGHLATTIGDLADLATGRVRRAQSAGGASASGDEQPASADGSTGRVERIRLT